MARFRTVVIKFDTRILTLSGSLFVSQYGHNEQESNTTTLLSRTSDFYIKNLNMDIDGLMCNVQMYIAVSIPQNVRNSKTKNSKIKIYLN